MPGRPQRRREGNFTDLASVLSGWNTSDAGDANGDGVTNFEDLQLILSFWGDC